MITNKTIALLAELSKLEFTTDEIDVLKEELNKEIKNISSKQILEACWTASTLARVDGVRLEPSFKGASSYDELCKKSRTNHFDFETKKQILLGYFFALEENHNKFLLDAWNQNLSEAKTLSALREDTVQTSMDIAKIMNLAPQANNGFFVVPQVVEQ